MPLALRSPLFLIAGSIVIGLERRSWLRDPPQTRIQDHLSCRRVLDGNIPWSAISLHPALPVLAGGLSLRRPLPYQSLVCVFEFLRHWNSLRFHFHGNLFEILLFCPNFFFGPILDHEFLGGRHPAYSIILPWNFPPQKLFVDCVC